MPSFLYPYVILSYNNGANFTVRGGETPVSLCGESSSGRTIVSSRLGTHASNVGSAYTSDNEGETWSPDYGAKRTPIPDDIAIGFERLKTLKDGSVMMSGYVNTQTFNISANDKPWDSGD